MKTTDTSQPRIRPAAQAGRFYESDPKLLSQEVDALLNHHNESATYDHLAALIVPHAGYYFSGNVAAAAYMTINPDKQYKCIFLLGPSHQTWIDGASVNTSADLYATPLGNVEVDKATALQLTKADPLFSYHPNAHAQEHCLEVQLPFLQRRLRHMPPIVPIIISTNEFEKLQRIAEVLKPYFNDENLFLISSDFSHYPSYEDACEVDGQTARAIESGDVEQFINTIEEHARSDKKNLSTSACGVFPIITLMLMLGADTEVKHLLYENSGDAPDGDHSQVVGYHAFAFMRHESSESFLSDNDKRQLKEIALASIRASLDRKGRGRATSSASGIPDSLKRKCGAFVSLHKQGHLRGCIGHFGEDVPLHEIVAEMAHAAAFEDPRFMPVGRDELDDIDIEISVLTPMRRIQSLDEFQLHRHGIYIRKGYRSGTYLPQVADEVDWTKEEFVAHCSHDKAGLGWNGWRDAELYVYEAIIF